MVQLFKVTGSGLFRRVVHRLALLVIFFASVGSLAAQDTTAKTVARKYSSVWLPDAVTDAAAEVDVMFDAILWLTGVVFVLVFVLMIYFLIRYRQKPGGKAIYNHGNTRLEIIWTIAPALIVIALGFYSKSLWSQMKQDEPKGADVLVIDVKPRQFQWDIAYSGADGKFGTPDDITAINQMHVPAGHPVLVNLTAQDVIHSFFVPEFRFKQDAVPGMVTRYWFTVPKPGQYEIACAELCGLGHYRMRGYVIVQTAAEFEIWYAEQKKAKAAELAPAPTPEATPAAATPTVDSAASAATSATSTDTSASSPAPADTSADGDTTKGATVR